MFTEYHRESQEKQLVTGPGDATYFGQITSQDIIEWCRPLFEQRGYHLRDSEMIQGDKWMGFLNNA